MHSDARIFGIGLPRVIQGQAWLLSGRGKKEGFVKNWWHGTDGQPPFSGPHLREELPKPKLSMDTS